MANHLRQKTRRSKKIGLAPGALVHIGEVKTTAPRITLIDYGEERLIEDEVASAEALIARPRTGAVLWINVYGLHDAALLAQIGEHFGLHSLVIEDILNTDQRPKVDEYGDYLFIVGHVFNAATADKSLERDQISLVLGHDFVLTFQERPTGTFEPLRKRLLAEKSPLRRLKADTLAYALLDVLVDRQFALVERMSDEAEALEDFILARRAPRTRTLHAIHRLKRNVVELRRAIWPLRETLHVLQRNTSGLFTPETLLYVRDVYDHAVHVVESLEALREQLSSILDVHLSTISQRLNFEVRTLTVITTIFMPSSLIAGIFGMNFKTMPWLDLPQGFWFALSLMGAIGCVMLATFWRRKLL